MAKNRTLTLRNTPVFISPYNAQHIGKRSEQQDSFMYSDILNRGERQRFGAVAVIADGMGGMENGRLSGKTATEVFMEVYKKEVDNIPDINKRMIYAAHCANEAVSALGNAGSTLCAAVIKDWQLHWLSIGDSRIYLYRNKTLRRLNKEHNYEAVLNEKVLKGEISLADAVSNPDRAALTSYLGIPELKEIDICTEKFPLFCGDSVMLCTDGLYRELSDEEMAYILTNGDETVCEQLIRAALNKNDKFQDNITITLMDID